MMLTQMYPLFQAVVISEFDFKKTVAGSHGLYLTIKKHYKHFCIIRLPKWHHSYCGLWKYGLSCKL